MVFSSLGFVFIFLPIFLVCYYLVPDLKKNAVLLAGSMVFYYISAREYPIHFAVFLLSIVVDFYAGLLIEQRNGRSEEKNGIKKNGQAGDSVRAGGGRGILILGILFHLACLGTFKYAGFLAQEWSRLVPEHAVSFHILLPIGISFYTFQGISYLADVYRGKFPAEKSLLRFAVYIAMFEQLIAGPIVTYDLVRRELSDRYVTKKDFFRGMEDFILGMGFKVILANQIGTLWTSTAAIGFESVSTALAWMAAVAYSLQIYFDFYGYSLMAIGLGRMLGFRLPKNFAYPYASRTMTEFWRRWHITLGAWFREYVYIPLGGSRSGQLRTIRNLFIVWVLTGIWHGAGYNFLIWGFGLFVLIFLEKFCYGKFLTKYALIGRIYMVLLIPLSWAVFEISDLRELGSFFTRVFPFFGKGAAGAYARDYVKYFQMYWPFLLAGLLCSGGWLERLLRRAARWIRWITLAAIFAGSVYCLYIGLNNPFLYFRF